MDQLGPLLPIVLLIGAFYLLIIRPARTRQNQANAVLRQLEPGKRIMTTAGLFGTVTAIEGDEIELEIAPGVQVRYVKGAVAKVIEPPEAVDPVTGTSAQREPSVLEGDTPEA
ncbi:MAG: preprotein translocase subunit YajC [Candidatus Nanopelagicales bacterium]